MHHAKNVKSAFYYAHYLYITPIMAYSWGGMTGRSGSTFYSNTFSATISNGITSTSTLSDMYAIPGTVSHISNEPVDTASSLTYTNKSMLHRSGPSTGPMTSSSLPIHGLSLEKTPSGAVTIGASGRTARIPPAIPSSNSSKVPASMSRLMQQQGGSSSNAPYPSSRSSEDSTTTVGTDAPSSKLGHTARLGPTVSQIRPISTVPQVASRIIAQSGITSPPTGGTTAEAAIITSTDTGSPANASIQGYTNPALATDGNYWLTTQVSGSTTIVPVIVGCPGCGQFGGTILWNFPSMPRINFKFPKFPKLPTISFPCVPIPWPVNKKCNTPSEKPLCEFIESFDSNRG